MPDDILEGTAELMRILPQISASEHTRDTSSREQPGTLLGKPLLKIDNYDKSSADCMSSEAALGIPVLTLIAELKPELAAGDPSVQVAFSYDRYYCQEQVNYIAFQFALF